MADDPTFGGGEPGSSNTRAVRRPAGESAPLTAPAAPAAPAADAPADTTTTTTTTRQRKAPTAAAAKGKKR